MGNRRKKVCFAASTGGHFEQLMMLKPLMQKYDSFIITEKTKYGVNVKDVRTYYLNQVNREENGCFGRLLVNSFRSLKIYLREKPDVIICTGVLAMIPMCLICKMFGKRLIYIESFAKVTSPTQTGKFLYKFADQFYVQWPQLKEIYPNAICMGGIY